MARARLGRGLAALLGDIDDDLGPGTEPGRTSRRVPVEFIRRNPRNPRQHFAEADLGELAESIRERGIIQPIVVRSLGGRADLYEIVAGERRWRAAQLAGLHDVPIVVVEADDKLALELAIIENVQRRDLNALEEATGYEALIAQHGYSQADLATALGKSRSHVANTVRLLRLPDQARAMLADGAITAGHARALLAVPDPDLVAARIVRDGLTVRDVERLGQDAVAEEAPPADLETKSRKPGRPRKARAADADTRALEAQLSDLLGLPVEIHHADPGGEVRVRYGTLDQLDGLTRALRATG